MAGEKEISKRIIRLVQKGDKLVQDIEKDVGQLIAAAGGVKDIISDIKNRLKGPDDSS